MFDRHCGGILYKISRKSHYPIYISFITNSWQKFTKRNYKHMVVK